MAAWKLGRRRAHDVAREIDVTVHRARFHDVRVVCQAAEAHPERPEAWLTAHHHRRVASHRERIAAHEEWRVERAGAAPDVEVLDRELLRPLHGVRGRRGVEAEEVVRVSATRVVAVELLARRTQGRAWRGVPGLARIRVEPRLEERLPRASGTGG